MKKHLHLFLASCLLGIVLHGQAAAQTFPTKAITIVSPFAPGGNVDAMARVLATKLSESLGVPVVVKNVGGASGTIGMAEVARASPDGYTLLYTPNSLAILPALYSKLSFDPEKDLVPVSQFISSALVVSANPKSNITTIADLISKAKAQPGKLNIGSSGIADPLQLGMEWIKTATGTEMVAVPYKGQGPMLLALLGGQVDVAILSIQLGLPYFRAGTLKPVAVTAAKRSAALPNVPTVAESGLVPGYDLSSWHGVFVPSKTPPDIIAKLQKAISAVAQDPGVRKEVEATGNETIGGTQEQFQNLFTADVKRFKTIVRDARLPMQD